jgi:hypothetical protein
MKEVFNMELGVHVSFGSFHYFEIKLYWDNDDGKTRISIYNLAASRLKDLGVIKRPNGYKKIREWLKTEEAKKIMKEITDIKYDGKSPYVFV